MRDPREAHGPYGAGSLGAPGRLRQERHRGREHRSADGRPLEPRRAPDLRRQPSHRLGAVAGSRPSEGLCVA